MRNMRNIMIEAHRMTKEIKNNSPEVDYRAQLGLCLSFFMMNKKEEKVMMVKLEGSEKQVKWAESLREEFIKRVQKCKSMFNVSSEKGKRMFKIDMAFALNTNQDDKNFKKLYEIEKEFNEEDVAEMMNNIDTYTNLLLENEKSAKFFIETRNQHIIFAIAKAYFKYSVLANEENIAENIDEDETTEMVELEGSEKQVKWATELRKEFIADIEEYKKFLNSEEEDAILRHARYFSMGVKKEFKEFLLNLNIDEEKLKKFKKKDSLYIMNNIDELKNKALNEKDSKFWIKTRNFGRDKSDNAFLIAVYEYLK